MKTWTTELASIKEVAFDHDLHIFEIHNDGLHLGNVYPDSIETMNELITELNNGACPIAEGWEDGNGNTCTLNGWS